MSHLQRCSSWTHGISVLLAVAATVSLACSGEKPDPAKLDVARKTVKVAEDTGAGTWAPDALAQAKAALADAEKEYKKQNRSLRRNRKHAHELALAATKAAQTATSASVAAEQAANKEARGFLRDAETLMIQAKGSLARIVRCKPDELPNQMHDLATQLEGASKAIQATKERIDQKAYREVISAGPGLVTSLEKLQKDAEKALRQTRC